MTLKVDIDELTKLGQKMHDLAAKAKGESLGNKVPGQQAASAQAGQAPLESVQAAIDISQQLFKTELIPALADRLADVGDAATGSAKAFQSKDDSNAQALANSFNGAVGDWVAPPAVIAPAEGSGR